jgi:hypothetical protein
MRIRWSCDHYAVSIGIRNPCGGDLWRVVEKGGKIGGGKPRVRFHFPSLVIRSSSESHQADQV